MNLEKRLQVLEENLGAKSGERIKGIVRLIVDANKPDAPMRYATGEGMEFFAYEDETEDEFCERVGAAMPRETGRLWRVLMYASAPANERIYFPSPCISYL
jgi:hypothetical protein